MTTNLRRTATSMLPLVWVSLALAVSYALSGPFGRYLHDQVDPHAWLAEHEANRLYYMRGCVHSEDAAQYLEAGTEADRFVVLAVDLEPSEEREGQCGRALRRIRAQSSPWWSVLPDSYLCDRLSSGAREWSDREFDGKMPGLVLAGGVLAPGFGDEQIASLEGSQSSSAP